jgi:hypothetical protein
LSPTKRRRRESVFHERWHKEERVRDRERGRKRERERERE